MKKSRILILVLLICSGCSSLWPIEAENGLTNQNNAITEQQVELIYSHVRTFPNQTQLSFAVIENGSINFYGVKRVNDTLYDVINHDKVFEIGSISKVFTSTLLANFVVDGRVKLDDKINEYLQVALNDSIQISFRELSNHTSGLPRMPSNIVGFSTFFHLRNPNKNYDKSKLEEYLVESLSVSGNRGEQRRYSNLGAGLLAYTLCNISESSYQRLLESYIFSRYQMTSSTTSRGDVKDKLVEGLDPFGNVTPNWDFGALAGAGAILSTVSDLSKFALAQYDSTNKELELTRVKTFSDTSNIDVGLGWHIVEETSGAEYYWHNGGTGGYTSSMGLDIEPRNAIIILSNVSAFNDNSRELDNLCFALLKTLKSQ
jgi:CubicO group peptidase (beta-lactamase class C family)